MATTMTESLHETQLPVRSHSDSISSCFAARFGSSVENVVLRALVPRNAVESFLSAQVYFVARERR